jgi:LCP family protein required for cell wall assembly
MTEWPDDWFRDAPRADGNQRRGEPGGAQGVGSQAAAGQQAAREGRPAADSADPTVQLRHRSAAKEGAPPGASGAAAQSAGPAQSGWPNQPASHTANPQAWSAAPPGRSGRAGGGLGGPPRAGWRRWLRPRPILAILAVLLSLAIVGSVATYFYLDSKLTRKNILVDYQGRPVAGSGTNWLITGSDSRQGLTRAQERKLHTGHDISGRRSDTIMVLHMPAGGGRPVLISLPRDSYVPIPGLGSDKINAAYAYGGPKLLAETVQNVTGLRIDHYMGIGFGGFVRVVNAIGGVRLCLKRPLVDRNSGLNLHKGCQTLNGGEALGFVRDRHSYLTQDLQRIQNQRLFVRALLRKLTSTGVLINPFASLPAASGVAGSLTVDKGTHLLQLLKVAFALRNPITTTVPISGGIVTSAGESALLWNRSEALTLFRDLNTGRRVPKNLISGSKLPGK